MTELLNPGIVYFYGLLGTTLASAGAGMGQDQGVLGAETLVPAGVFISGITITGILVWRIASQKSKYDLDMYEMRSRLENLERKIEENDQKD